MADEEAVDATDVHKFDFIGDSGFRASLTADYLELEKCHGAGAWKAVHVLSGSVVEAVLVEYLVATKYVPASGKDVLRLQLGDLIAECKQLGILSDKAADLSTVVRSYRNLIHPGRGLRLNETVDKESATVARALVNIVVEEVTAARKKKCGYTAEQVIAKLESDPTCLSILSYILKDTHEYERGRLTLEVIPERYGASPAPNALELCFRQAFDTLPPSGKTKALANFVKTLKEGSGDNVVTYETVFFRASDWAFLTAASDVEVVREHLLHQLEKTPSAKLLAASAGLGKFLTEKNVTQLFFWLMIIIVNSDDAGLRKAAEDLFDSEYWNLPDHALRDKVSALVTGFEQDFQEDHFRDILDRIIHVRARVLKTAIARAKAANTLPF